MAVGRSPERGAAHHNERDKQVLIGTSDLRYLLDRAFCL